MKTINLTLYYRPLLQLEGKRKFSVYWRRRGEFFFGGGEAPNLVESCIRFVCFVFCFPLHQNGTEQLKTGHSCTVVVPLGTRAKHGHHLRLIGGKKGKLSRELPKRQRTEDQARRKLHSREL